MTNFLQEVQCERASSPMAYEVQCESPSLMECEAPRRYESPRLMPSEGPCELTSSPGLYNGGHVRPSGPVSSNSGHVRPSGPALSNSGHVRPRGPALSSSGRARPSGPVLSNGGHVSGRFESPEVPEDGPDSSLSEDGNAPKPPFLIGEEKEDEVGLSDGKSIFIDDVLENAEWCVLLKCGVYPHSEQNL